MMHFPTEQKKKKLNATQPTISPDLNALEIFWWKLKKDDPWQADLPTATWKLEPDWWKILVFISEGIRLKEFKLP